MGGRNLTPTLVVGAILSFGVADRISGVNLVMIGYIVMGGGVLALLFGLLSAGPRRASSTTTTQHSDGTVSSQSTDSVVDDRPEA